MQNESLHPVRPALQSATGAIAVARRDGAAVIGFVLSLTRPSGARRPNSHDNRRPTTKDRLLMGSLVAAGVVPARHELRYEVRSEEA